MQALVVAVHGSAVDDGRVLARLLAQLRNHTPAPVTLGHLDHRTPTLAHALAENPDALVVPLLLGDGYHRTVDIPRVARNCTVTPGLSGEPAVALALHERLRALPGRPDAVVVAGAGSSRPGGNDGTLRAAEQLRPLLPVPVTVAYCSASSPTPEEAVVRLRADGFRRIAVAAHLLAPGRFTRALAAVPGVRAVTEPLADHPRIAELVAARYETRAMCAGPPPALLCWGT
ncbi:sirohydrochlorin chelatase [Streptomyces sp. NPDC055815]